MTEAYIVDAVRTPVGKRGGGLALVHPADLGAHSLTALVERTGIDPAAVEDVVFGCVDTIGGQAGDIARTCWLAAGLPEHVPGTTVDRQCGSSQQAIHFAAQAVLSGTMDVVVAGGVQQMSQIPISAAMTAGQALGFDDPFTGSPGWVARYGTQEVSQFRSAELIAGKWDIGRDEMEAFAVESHARAIRARRRGSLRRRDRAAGRVHHRRGPPGARLGQDTLAAGPDRGRTGDRGVLVADLRRLGCAADRERAGAGGPRALASGPDPPPLGAGGRPGVDADGADPRDGPRAGQDRHALDDIDLVEINEAFASVVIAWAQEAGADMAKVNVNGGAIALGHPLGATGARLMTTLLHELERRGGRWGLQTMCEGGGQANVTIIERL